MDNLGLKSAHFNDGRMNMGSLVDFQKGETISENDFNEVYGKGGYRFHTKKELQEIQSQLTKAEGEEMETDIHTGSLTRHLVAMKDGSISEIYTSKIATSEHIEKAENNDLEKGILDYNTKVTVKKKGEEIIEKMETLLTKMEAKKVEIKTQMNECVEHCGSLPTEELDNYEKNGVETDVKRYSWEMTYYNDEKGMSHASIVNTQDSVGASSKEQAQHCRKYNSLVYDYTRVCADIKVANFYKENLDEKKMYELSAEEGVKLGF